MARILGDESDKLPASTSKARALIIGGVRFTHAAARFWASLLSEVAADYPDCNALVFETMSGTVLTRDLLFPEMALQRELDRLQPTVPIEQALKEALAELEIFGPPGTVQLSLLAPARNATHSVAGGDDRVIKRCQLPLDCVDADIFAYLLTWLMEWAELPESQWNSDHVEGAFPVHDPDLPESWDTASGRVQFEFTRRHISEGLYRWCLLMRRVALAGEPRNGEPRNGEPRNGEPRNGEPRNGEPGN
ncbi:MAG: hypothetical protein KJ692_12165 [Verrucomicrobia bacterium]|nr:hypothetical protein [Verrucomicrobiota bacterium]